MKPSFDFATLYFCAMVTAFSATLAMFYVWRIHGREPAVRYWALGYLCCAIPTAMFALPGLVPSGLAKSLGNLIAMASIALVYIGTARFIGRPVRWWLLAAALAVAGLANLYWSLWQDGMAQRIFAYSLTVALSCALMAYDLLVGGSGPQRLVYRFVAICWSLFAAATLGRSMAFLAAGPGLEIDNLGVPQWAWFAALQATMILTAVGHLLMASQRLQLRLDELASLDELTGVFNRRAFLAAFNQQQSAAAPKRGGSAVLMLDLDHFKRINDRHGHAAGDLVLRDTAGLVRGLLRDRDVFARAGGEEFWLLLPGVDASVASAVAERLRAAVESHRFEFEGQAIPVTMSIGIALLGGDAQDGRIHAALARADGALYEAKTAGRNRVVIAAA